MNFLQKEKQGNRSNVMQVPVGRIIPNSQQQRHSFDNGSLYLLSQSIKQNGILQPLTVRERENGKFELVAGERRLRAAMMAGYKMVPCITVALNEKQSAIMNLLENLQREDLNFFEEAAGIGRLLEHYRLTQLEIAKTLGMGQSTVANKLRLLRIDENQRKKIIDLGLTERHARALLRLSDNQRDEAIKEIEQHNLNVEETDKLVESMLFPQKVVSEHRNLTVIKDVRIFFNTINNAVNLMKRSGIDAVAKRQEYDEYYEYTVKIPKSPKTIGIGKIA